MKGQVRIEQMFAFIVMDDDDTEGIPAIQVGDMHFPLVGADMARVDSLRPYVADLAKATGKKITLCRFSTREELEAWNEE